MKTKIHLDGFDGWAKRARARAKAISEGRAVTPSRGITFENAAEMVRLLTPARLDLLAAVRDESASVKALADRLGRDVSAVRKDVVALERFGIVQSEAVANPGHGKLRLVSAPHRITISAEI